MNVANSLSAPWHRRHPLTALTLGFCLWSPLALSAENPGAHQHGQARMQIAYESDRMDLILTSPAYNLAGFEHAARSQEEKQVLADIRSWMETNPLIQSASGACRIEASEVDLGGSVGHGDEHGHEDEHAHEDEHDHGADTHRDHEIAQTLICDNDISEATFNSPLIARFPGMEKLVIEWVGETGQGSTVIRSSDDQFRLGGQ